MIARRDFADEPPDFHGDARAFVSEHDRLRDRKGLVAHRHVGMAYAGGDELHQDFVVARLGEVEHLQ